MAVTPDMAHVAQLVPLVTNGTDTESPQPSFPVAVNSQSQLLQSLPVHVKPLAEAFSSAYSDPQGTAGILQPAAAPASPAHQFTISDVKSYEIIPEKYDESDDFNSPTEPITPVSGRESPSSLHLASASTVSPSTGRSPRHSHHGPKHHHHNSRQQHQQQHRQHYQRQNRQGTTYADPFVLADGANSLGDSGSGLETLVTLTPPPESADQTQDSPGITDNLTRPSTAVGGSFLIAAPSGAGADPSAFQSDSSPNSPRRPRGSSSTTNFKRTMSNFFRRSSSHTDKVASIDQNPADAANQRKTLPNRRWSVNRALDTTQPSSPPSPDSPPLEMAYDDHKPAHSSQRNSNSRAASAVMHEAQEAMLPAPADFNENNNRQGRQQQVIDTSLSFGPPRHIVTGPVVTSKDQHAKHSNSTGDFFRRRLTRRASDPSDRPSDMENQNFQHMATAAAGIGLKSRRISLCLPDDFNVDVVDLHTEFDYQHMLGRHRRYIGKGATSKVTLMYRKGFSDELYAVKEFRGKKPDETREVYEKKVKSEYSMAKSLHHPNIVETVRLCLDHGRWNHVMEYCQEGDLFSLVEKNYLKNSDRLSDRLCLFKQLVQGLNYLHCHGIAHRDIKLENLLITKSSKLKITDFGASEVFSGIHPGLREAGGQCGCNCDGEVRLCKPGICGSRPYISPEVLEAKEPYDPRKLDVWAAGVVVVCLFFGAPLWSEALVQTKGTKRGQYADYLTAWAKCNEKKRKTKAYAEKEEADRNAAMMAAKDVTSGEAAGGEAASGEAASEPETDTNANSSVLEEPWPQFMPFNCFITPLIMRRILLQMMHPDPNKRLTIEKVANHRWVRSIECCQLESYDDPMAPSNKTGGYVIDAARGRVSANGRKVYCHDHLPPKSHRMP